MDGISLELIGYSFINFRDLSFDSRTTSRSYGGVVSALFILFYVCYLLVLIYTIRQVNKVVYASEKTTGLRFPIVDVKNSTSKSISLSMVLSEYREDLKYNNEKWVSKLIYLPVITGIKNIVVQILMVSMLYFPMAQLISILCVETVYLVMVCFGRVKKRRYDNIYDISMSIITCLVIILKLVSVLIPEDKRDTVDVILSIILLLIPCSTFLYCFSRIEYIKDGFKNILHEDVIKRRSPQGKYSQIERMTPISISNREIELRRNN